MRLTILFASLALALSACKKSESSPRSPACPDRGFIQEVDGHHFAVIMQGDAAVVIPIDQTRAMMATGIHEGKITGDVSAVTALDLGRFAICPCCAIRCNNCDPGVIGVGCFPGLDIKNVLELAGGGGGDLPQVPNTRDPVVKP